MRDWPMATQKASMVEWRCAAFIYGLVFKSEIAASSESSVSSPCFYKYELVMLTLYVELVIKQLQAGQKTSF